MKYKLRRKIRDFRYNHDFIFNILKLFLVMVITCVSILVVALPIGLCLYFGFWWILSAFIIWPVGFNSIAWIIDCLDAYNILDINSHI